MRLIYSKFAVFTIVLLLGICKIDAQSYHYSFQDDQPTFVSSFIVWASSHLYAHYQEVEILDEFEDVDLNGIWSFDRKAVFQDSKSADLISDITMYSSAALPIVLLITDKSTKTQSWSIFMMGMQGYFLTNGITQFVKISAERPRPYIYSLGTDALNIPLSKNATKSFFSGHTSSSAYFSFFTAKVFSDLHPDSNWKPVVWTAAALLPATTGFLRYKAGKHFPSDVFVGYCFGAAMGILLPEFYKNGNLQIRSSNQGIGVSLYF